MLTTLTCRLVPGSDDRVKVLVTNHQEDVPLTLVRSVLGREAVDSLYLRGVFVLTLELDTAEWLAGQLHTDAEGRPT